VEANADQAAQRSERFNPFPGLRPFEPDEDHLFFGRERETDELLRRLRSNRFVSVLGTSGSGKSSLVRSGLIPSLYSGFMVQAGSDWRVAILRPGEDPIGNLAAALDSPDVLGGDDQLGGAGRVLLETSLRRSSVGLADCARHSNLAPQENLLVVVDQFEELFRFRETRREHGSRDEAIAFAKLLLGAAADENVSVYVVLTMRSDFIGDCMEYPGLPEAINEGQYLIPRMTREELRQAISGPVAVGGGKITPRLVSRLLNEVGDDPDQLPVLQHALMRSWDRWEGAGGEALDLEHYEDTGTMSEALSLHAEEAYAELDAGDKIIAERLFKALTDKRKDERGVRRPTPIDEVAAIAGCSADDVIRVVEVFRKPGRSFLMPPSVVELSAESIVDVSHESLMRGWTRLVQWVDDETQSGKAFRRLCRAARR
jgi:energy-coupling factor transporter ATP-binding protein EcfA2